MSLDLFPFDLLFECDLFLYKRRRLSLLDLERPLVFLTGVGLLERLSDSSDELLLCLPSLDLWCELDLSLFNRCRLSLLDLGRISVDLGGVLLFLNSLSFTKLLL